MGKKNSNCLKGIRTSKTEIMLWPRYRLHKEMLHILITYFEDNRFYNHFVEKSKLVTNYILYMIKLWPIIKIPVLLTTSMCNIFVTRIEQK